MKKFKVVTIGGGKGQGTMLTGLKRYREQLELSAIVSMVDDGGSTGRISEELDIPPFGGDFRDVLTALSDDADMINMFHHRFEHGKEIKGHSVGNLILLGLLEQSKWDIPKAIEQARKILDVKEDVWPSTLDRITLVAEYDDGTKVVGQNEIDNDFNNKYKTIKKVYSEPVGKGFEKAVRAIKEADFLILTPGDIYGSLLCNIIIPEIKEAIKESKCKIFYITNLMTKVNQTHEWKSSDFIEEVQSYIPKPIDYAIVNIGKLSEDVTGKKQYQKESWEIVENDIEGEIYKDTKIIKDVVWYEGHEFKRVKSDVIPRSFIRHNPDKISDIIFDIISNS